MFDNVKNLAAVAMTHSAAESVARLGPNRTRNATTFVHHLKGGVPVASLSSTVVSPPAHAAQRPSRAVAVEQNSQQSVAAVSHMRALETPGRQ